MQLQVDAKQKELKEHGGYGLPVRTSLEKLADFEQGAFAWHWHPEIELTYFVKGEMCYQINQREYQVHAGQSLFCNTNALHVGHMIDGQECEYISVTFHPRMVYGYTGSEVEQKLVAPLLEATGFDSILFDSENEVGIEISEKIQAIYEINQQSSDTKAIRIQQQLLSIWLEIYACFKEKQQKAPDCTGKEVERLRVILNYIHEHFDEQISLEQIAEEVHLCKSECSRFFKKQMKQTLFEYLPAYRVSKSLALLKKGYSVTEAGSACGFLNPAYYSRVFKEKMGMSPRAYKDRYNN